MLVEVLAVAAAALLASTIAGVTGFGGAVLLLPVLVAAVGARDAVVVLTVAQLAGNGSRVFFNREDIDTGVLRRFALGAVPAALAGGALFIATPAAVLTRLLGAFLIASVIWRRAPTQPPRLDRSRFLPLGAGFGFLSAILGSVGPLMAPFFLAHGLVKAAYIGTEAACTVVMHTTKLVAYGGGGVLASDALLRGLALAPVMVIGSWAGKHVLDRLPERLFVLLIEVVLIVSGALLIHQDMPQAATHAAKGRVSLASSSRRATRSAGHSRRRSASPTRVADQHGLMLAVAQAQRVPVVARSRTGSGRSPKE